MKKNLNDDNSNGYIKANEFKVAIEKYNSIVWYSRVEVAASVIIVFLQIASLIKLFQHYTAASVIAIIVTVVIGYIVTDFISGIAHMIGDNNTHYTSIIGPFVAAFHLHHARLTYKNNHPIKIYFYESGQKFWLVFYLLILFTIQNTVNLNFCLDLFLVIIGVLSSVAELSHFWCHNRTQCNIIIRTLQKYRILLSMQHHRFHHCNDNTHYAFLNGMTDSVVNLIANHLYMGYKKHADKHVAVYDGYE